MTSESRYLWCGERICQKRSATDVVTGRYFDEGEVTATGQRAYYARDHLGSVRDVLDVSTGSLLRSIDYYPNGKIKTASGTFEPEFEFAGMQSFPFMATGGALLTHYRVYDPALGRWLSRDPIEEAGGINLYGYVGGDFINKVDPLGLSPWTDFKDIMFPTMCESPPPQECDPPEGTMCYGSWETDHEHKGKQPHRHLYQHQFNRTTNKCQWKKLRDTKYTVGLDDKNANIITPDMMPCQWYTN